MTKPFKEILKPTIKTPERIVEHLTVNGRQYYRMKWQGIETTELIEREVAAVVYWPYVFVYCRAYIESLDHDTFMKALKVYSIIKRNRQQ